MFEDRNGDVLYYIYNGSELLGFVYKNKTYYYHKNMFGDIISILDSSYNEIVTYEYDSWGALVNITDNSNINLGTINPFRYRSYYYDEESGFYYLNSRYYNPKMGRFINADSYVSTGQGFNGNNMFVYCGNNSIVRGDRKGYAWWEFIGGLTGSMSAQENEDESSYLPTIIGVAVSTAMAVILAPELSIGAFFTVSAYGATAAATTKYAQGTINNNTDYIVDIVGNTVIDTMSNGFTSFFGGIDPAIDAFISGHISSYLSGEIVYNGKTKAKPKYNPSIFEDREPICSATIKQGKVTTDCFNTKTSTTKNNVLGKVASKIAINMANMIKKMFKF